MKTVSAILASVLTCAVLAACGGGGSGAAAPNATAVQAAQGIQSTGSVSVVTAH